MANPFLPDDYEVSGGSASNYMRFEDGENKLRFLASPIIGWEWWVNSEGTPRSRDAKPQKGDKPVRVPRDGEVPVDAAETVREFWAVPVWNFAQEKVQVLEITQKTIMRTIYSLARDKEWGSPLGYNISIIKSGEKLDTEYEVIPSPPKALSKEAQQAWKEVQKNNFDIKRLYDGGDPFGNQPNTDTSDAEDLV